MARKNTANRSQTTAAARQQQNRSQPSSSGMNIGTAAQQNASKTYLSQNAGGTVSLAEAQRAAQQSNLPVAAVRRQAQQMGLGIGRQLSRDNYRAPSSALAQRTRANRRAMESGVVNFDAIRNYNDRRFAGSAGNLRDARATFDRALGVNQDERIRSAFQDPLGAVSRGTTRAGFALRGGGAYNPNDVLQTAMNPLTDEIRSRINPNRFIGGTPSAAQGMFLNTNQGYIRGGTQGRGMSLRQARQSMNPMMPETGRRTRTGGQGGATGGDLGADAAEPSTATQPSPQTTAAAPTLYGEGAVIGSTATGFQKRRSSRRTAGPGAQGTGSMRIAPSNTGLSF